MNDLINFSLINAGNDSHLHCVALILLCRILLLIPDLMSNEWQLF